jgi:hypothetical protein
LREISLRGKECITKKILFIYVTFGEKYTIGVDIIVQNEPRKREFAGNSPFRLEAVIYGVRDIHMEYIPAIHDIYMMYQA